MKRATLCLVALFGVSLLTQAQRAVPRAPIHAGFENDEFGASSAPRPPSAVREPAREQVQHDADELASLARSISSGVNDAQKGVRSKDLGENLRRIERVARRLRGELAL